MKISSCYLLFGICIIVGMFIGGFIARTNICETDCQFRIDNLQNNYNCSQLINEHMNCYYISDLDRWWCR